MPELRDIIARLKQGQSIHSIHAETRTHRRDIRRLRELARRAGWLETGRALPDEFALRIALEGDPDRSRSKPHELDAFREDLKRWRDEKVPFTTIHRMLVERTDCSETTIRRYIQKHFPRTPRVTMRRVTVPGEVMEVDYGYLGLTYDPQTQRNRKTYVFSARLRHSRRAYREVVFSQKQEVFFDCHIHAFEHFGGVPRKVVPDNLKAAVIRASFNDPLVNRAYRLLAEHYDFLISPCLPYRPRHKGGVESDIKYVKRNFWPQYKERERNLGHELPHAEEIQRELERWDAEVADVRTISGLGRAPREIFENEERIALKALPRERWDRPEWKQCKAQADWHIQFGRAFYSVPYRYVGRKLMVCGTARFVRIFDDTGEIAVHPRAARLWQRRTRDDHAPPGHAEYLQLTRRGVEQQAARLGEAVLGVVRQIFDDRAVDGLRPARGVLGLAHKYGIARLNRACARALAFGTPSYRSVKNILLKNLDMADADEASEEAGQRHFRFAREHGYFDVSNFENRKQGEVNG